MGCLSLISWQKNMKVEGFPYLSVFYIIFGSVMLSSSPASKSHQESALKNCRCGVILMLTTGRWNVGVNKIFPWPMHFKRLPLLSLGTNKNWKKSLVTKRVEDKNFKCSNYLFIVSFSLHGHTVVWLNIQHFSLFLFLLKALPQVSSDGSTCAVTACS